MLTKKQHELACLVLVRNHLGGYPPGNPVELSDDRPDFRYEIAGDILGIDVTRLTNQEALGQFAEQTFVIQGAEKLYREMELPPIDVKLWFSFDHLLTKRKRSELTQHIFEIVRMNIPQSLETICLRQPDCRLKSEIELIRLFRVPDSQIHNWWFGRSGAVNDSFEAELQAEIGKKESRLSGYLERCSRCWLIISADWDTPESFFQFSDRMQPHIYHTNFERVFFVDRFDSKVYELAVARDL